MDSYFPCPFKRDSIQYSLQFSSFMEDEDEDEDVEFIHADDDSNDYESSDEDEDEEILPQFEPYEAGDKTNEIKIGDNFDLSCLFTPTRNYLIRNNGEKVYVNDLVGKYIIILGFYIPIPKDTCIAKLCKNVIAAHSELINRGLINKVEFVLVTCMRPDFPEFEQHRVVEDCFNHLFSAFSFPAIPIFDVACSKKLLRAMGIYGYYDNDCLIVSPYGKVLQTNPKFLSDYGAHFYPFTDERLTELDSLMAAIPDGGVLLLEHILYTDTCDVLPVPDCGISAEKVYFQNITKKYVWLYLFRGDGSGFGKFLHLWSLHEDVEFVVVFPIGADMIYMEYIRDMCRQGIRMLKQHYGLNRRLLECRMSCLLQHQFSSWCHSSERLAVVGPGFVDTNGADLYRDYGDAAFPFSKKLLYKSLIERLRSTTIEKVTCKLPPPCLELNGRDVFFYMRYSSKVFECEVLEWERMLPRWCTEIKSSNPNFQFVILCHEDEESVLSWDENSWLWIPYEHSKKVYEMFESLNLPTSQRIYAYGADGNLVSIEAEEHIDKSTTAIFPDRSYLEQDIIKRLKDSREYWGDRFKFS